MRLLLILISACCFLSFQIPWKEYTDHEGRFSVLVPGELSKKEIPVATQIGELVYHSYYYQPTEKDPDNILYMLSYCDYPEGGMHSDSVALLESFFEATLESALESVKGELLYSTDTKLQNYPAKLWRLTYQDGEASIKSKAILAQNRFFMIQTVGFRDKGINPNIDKFLDSFRIVE